MVAVFSCSPALYCGHGKKQRPKRGAKGEVYGKSCGRSDSLLPQAGGPDAGAAGRGDGRLRCGGEQVGAGAEPSGDPDADGARGLFRPVGRRAFGLSAAIERPKERQRAAETAL